MHHRFPHHICLEKNSTFSDLKGCNKFLGNILAPMHKRVTLSIITNGVTVFALSGTLSGVVYESDSSECFTS